ncbi:hypothetical protein XBJ2_1930036 [Xenorhabdus bovienii str. Jollieti]|uniref:Uncharacterized protein n=1 Tax=Xenorhabdus bovienii (strain SS-2004) TaxID=406818 RepID=D3V5N8_XENBS|nr:hypothetical protein XBJ1_3849 [Xenorhabdus bovienii SS-2004]CDH28720.1 hypothetical protein XBJ2_1930036 [Xenorhabdus bovienii str. Jollieti]
MKENKNICVSKRIYLFQSLSMNSYYLINYYLIFVWISFN